MVLLIVVGCSTSRGRGSPPPKNKMKPAARTIEMALPTVVDPISPRSEMKSPEEWSPAEKSKQIKTWLERSRGYLEKSQFDEALREAEQIFRIEADHLEASRLVDEIKEKARGRGEEEGLFLQGVYQEEIKERVGRYAGEAETHLRAGRLGAARMAVEKLLLLDPENREGHRLLALLEVEEEISQPSLPETVQAGNEARKAL